MIKEFWKSLQVTTTIDNSFNIHKTTSSTLFNYTKKKKGIRILLVLSIIAYTSCYHKQVKKIDSNLEEDISKVYYENGRLKEQHFQNSKSKTDSYVQFFLQYFYIFSSLPTLHEAVSTTSVWVRRIIKVCEEVSHPVNSVRDCVRIVTVYICVCVCKCVRVHK